MMSNTKTNNDLVVALWCDSNILHSRPPVHLNNVVFVETVIWLIYPGHILGLIFYYGDSFEQQQNTAQQKHFIKSDPVVN